MYNCKALAEFNKVVVVDESYMEDTSKNTLRLKFDASKRFCMVIEGATYFFDSRRRERLGPVISEGFWRNADSRLGGIRGK
jgi:hypothetical protein